MSQSRLEDRGIYDDDFVSQVSFQIDASNDDHVLRNAVKHLSNAIYVGSGTARAVRLRRVKRSV
ncbi:hypothetical protein RMSM_00636 [Rhodopirellula maiorica SM1]|uniref:Uncharacterized protein n=1 Tax=Rhodopirellula maiorica SM1 TaxID=1265738 RepID=M5RTA8_9BACT|nr:hypothetical protein RMSM_00636 [Rhodopirellula maiorica SM1]